MQRPEIYQDLISEDDYVRFVAQCVAAVKALNIVITSVESGAINYKLAGGEDAHFYLDNLLKTYLLLPEEDREEAIHQHFDRLRDRSDAYNYFFKDWDYAKQFLKVLIKPKEMLEGFSGFVHRMDYPNLATFLVFDFENQLRYIRTEDAAQWELDEEVLFETALDNIAGEEMEIQQGNYEDRFPIFLLLSGDFSASYTLLIQHQLDFAIGTYGTMIAVPAKGVAFLHPVETTGVLDLAVILQSAVEKFYYEDPSNISLDFYWWYEGHYYLFEKITKEDDTIVITLPLLLAQLFSR